MEQLERGSASQGTETALTLKELHHRIKNNLQLVCSLLQLQAARSQEPAVRDLVAQTVPRIEAIAELHASLYQNERVDRLEAGAYLTDLCQRLAASFLEQRRDGVALVVDIRPLWLKSDQAVLLGLMVNELVTNAFKHAFAGGHAGTVRVSLQPAGSGWQLEVADDGPVPPGEPPVGQPAGLGMRLVDGMARRLGGTVRVDASAGYRVTVRLPPIGAAIPA